MHPGKRFGEDVLKSSNLQQVNQEQFWLGVFNDWCLELGEGLYVIGDLMKKQGTCFTKHPLLGSNKNWQVFFQIPTNWR